MLSTLKHRQSKLSGHETDHCLWRAHQIYSIIHKQIKLIHSLTQLIDLVEEPIHYRIRTGHTKRRLTWERERERKNTAHNKNEAELWKHHTEYRIDICQTIWMHMKNCKRCKYISVYRAKRTEDRSEQRHRQR